MLLVVNLTRPPAPAPVDTSAVMAAVDDAANKPEESGTANGDGLPTSVSQPAEPEQLEAWLAKLESDPQDTVAITGLSRQIDWLGEQAELDFAAGDDKALLERKELATGWHERFGEALNAPYTRFQRRLTGLLVSEQRQAQISGNDKDAKRAEQLLQSLGYAPEDEEPPQIAEAPAKQPPTNAQRSSVSLSGLVTRKQYAAFVDATKREDSRCRNQLSPLRIFDRRSWREPGFEQADNDPVVCVSAADALAYLDWVGQRDGRSYRLPAPTERPQNQAGLAEWTNACIASGDAAQPCPRRVAAGPLLQERQLDIDRGYDDVSFRWVAK